MPRGSSARPASRRGGAANNEEESVSASSAATETVDNRASIASLPYHSQEANANAIAANTAAAATTTTTTTTSSTIHNKSTGSSLFSDEESLVIAYLRKHGLTQAVTELQSILKNNKEVGTEGGSSSSSTFTTSTNTTITEEGKKRSWKEGALDEDDAGKDAKKQTLSKKLSSLPPIDYDVEEEDDDDVMNEYIKQAEGFANIGGGAVTTPSTTVITSANVNANTTANTSANANTNSSAAGVVGAQTTSSSSHISSRSSGGEKVNNDNLFASATGGGFGYDLDAAPTVALWGASARCGAPSSLSSSYLPPLQIRDAYAREMLSLQRQGKNSRQRKMNEGVGDVGGGDDVGADETKGEDGDATMADSHSGDTEHKNSVATENKKEEDVKEGVEEKIEAIVFRDEARRYIEGYTSLMTWILTLPDDPANPIITSLPVFDDAAAEHPVKIGNEPVCGGGGGDNEVGEAQAETHAGGDEAAAFNAKDDDDKMDVDKIDSEIPLEKRLKSAEINSPKHIPHDGLATLVKHSLVAAGHYELATTKTPTVNLTLPLGASLAIPSASSFQHDPLLLPPSVKPELLALSFPLLVHTYCELLSVGFEHTSLAFLDTYRHLYETTYPTELLDLDKCQSTKCIVELNNDVIAHSVLLSEMRVLSSQFPLVKRKLSEIEREHERVKSKSTRSSEEEKLLRDHEKRVAKYNHTLSWTQNKFVDLSSRNDVLTKKLLALPFLRRVRAFKWNITISISAFEALTGFVSSRDDLLPMSALLQSRCHLIVERRDPLPFCPPAILDDIMDDNNEGRNSKNSVRWAAAIHPMARAIEAGEDLATSGLTGNEPPQRLPRSILRHSEALPFPKIRLDNDGDETNENVRTAVEFNRALLINGFRRLEALELKQEYEAGMFSSAGLGPSRQVHIADALQPSILLATICSSPSSSSTKCSEADVGAGPAADSKWMEPNIGITSASICPPDGRKVALGCDDSAVRIWSLDRSTKSAKSSSQNNSTGASLLGEPSIVLLGHKNGFPVFDVDWTRNGRTLLSAGGDGTLRLWDTQAVGPYGELSNVTVHQKGTSSHTIGGPASTSLSTVVVPGSKAESLVKVGGAALSVYRGHAPSTPVWGVSSAPCGYYFASAGSDYTARIWATDRTSPVRVLCGHVSPSVNCVAWHPNCNYVVTASDDKTCRMFDIQTGRCVRLLSGSTRGLNLVRVSPSGRYAAGSGYDGVVRIWDLGNGRVVNELRPESSSLSPSTYSEGLIHAMSFSSCGAALAVSGVDSTVRIWDVRGATNHSSDPDYFAATRGPTATSSFSDGLSGVASKSQLERMSGNVRSRPGTRLPAKIFNTNNVSILDLRYTKRNLLLAVGDC